MPILRTFHPFQAQPSSTSEENRKRSMAKSTGKPRRRAQVRLQEEPSASSPVEADIAILLFPLNVS
jgi:hypothetical protein